ncbi:MAG: cbb3-type cytochrome c oxidase N-terminal domain-containing protein [Bernardetiaceae bacterium]
MQRLKSIFQKLTTMLLLLFLPLAVWAQESSQRLVAGISNADLLLLVLGTMVAFLTVAFLVVAFMLYRFMRTQIATHAVAEEEALAQEGSGFWKWFWNKFNAAAPIHKEKDILLDHEYDGIHELDNDLPPWWKYGFYMSIVFAVVYIFYYHGDVEAKPVSIRELHAEMDAAEVAKAAYLAKMGSMVDESNVTLLTDADALARGKEIYVANCQACHLADGGGQVGPNLTDEHWIHGCDISDVFKTIKYGVIEKGMLPWNDKLKPDEIQKVSSYVLSLMGTTPAVAKAPQGDVCATAPAETE